MVLIRLWATPDGEIGEHIQGTMAPCEIVYALEDIKRRILAGEGRGAAPPMIPGMLKGDGTRVKIN